MSGYLFNVFIWVVLYSLFHTHFFTTFSSYYCKSHFCDNIYLFSGLTFIAICLMPSPYSSIGYYHSLPYTHSFFSLFGATLCTSVSLFFFRVVRFIVLGRHISDFPASARLRGRIASFLSRTRRTRYVVWLDDVVTIPIAEVPPPCLVSSRCLFHYACAVSIIALGCTHTAASCTLLLWTILSFCIYYFSHIFFSLCILWTLV